MAERYRRVENNGSLTLLERVVGGLPVGDGTLRLISRKSFLEPSWEALVSLQRIIGRINAVAWWKTLGAGLLSGITAALLMTLVLLLLRSFFGLATPSELVGDRIAPLLGVDRFLELLNRFGGYNNLKQLGVMSVLGGQLVVGTLGGVAYGFLVDHPQAIEANHTRDRGRLFVVLFVGFLWLVSLIFLWPVLGTSYVGRPPAIGALGNIVGLLFAYAVYGLSLVMLYRTMIVVTDVQLTDKTSPGRRALLVTSLGAVAAIVVGGLLRRLYHKATFSYDGTRYKGADVQAITPNDRFYVVTKNVVDPEVARSNWRLDIGGLVEQPRTYSFEELAALPSVTQETTLRCISNQVGDGLMSNAVWKGVPLRSLIDAAGAKKGVVEVILHGVDNYTDTFDIEKALEPTTLVAYEMNGEMIPPRHGFPVRVIVPGLFGEKNVKWVTRIELVDHDAKGFYEQQGWGPNFVVPTTARFDVPEDKQKIKLPTPAVSLRGVAHAGDRGILKVEVSTDDGKSWSQANITHAESPLSWVLWNYDWRPTQVGQYKLVVRATDGEGELQTEKERGTVPEGATGYHKITTQIDG